MSKQRKEQTEQRERGGVSILIVLSMFAVVLILTLTSIQLSNANLRHSGEVREDTDAHFLLMAGVNYSFNEIKNETDLDGDGGLGSVGIATPIEFTSSTGKKHGEFRAYVINKTGLADPNDEHDFTGYDPAATPPFYVIRVMAAVPDFADPIRTYTAEAVVGSDASFAFQPKAGAMSISGPINNMQLRDFDDGSFLVDGGAFPGFIVTDAPTVTEVMDEIGDEIRDGNLSNPLTNISGTPQNQYTHPDIGDFDLSLVHEPGATFTAQMLNDYRDALRTYAQDLVNTSETGSGNNLTSLTDYSSLDTSTGIMTNSDGDEVIVVHALSNVKDGAGTGLPRIKSNLNFGTASVNSKTVLIDTGEFHEGGKGVADNYAGTSGERTITGAGTLVILHPIGSTSDTASHSDSNAGKLFNLNWTGDVFIVGYPKDKSGGGHGNNPQHGNLLFISGAKWNIDGNLIAVTAGNTEASLEMEGTSSSGSGLAELNVNGALMMFAEATGQESEIDIESNAHLTVDGIAGMFGARIELEDQASSSTKIHVNGTFTIGLPAGNTRTDDFYWKVNGSTQLRYDDDKAQKAAAGLSALQANLSFSSNNLTNLDFNSLGIIVHRDQTQFNLWGLGGTNDLQQLLDGAHDLGVDPSLIED